MHGSLEKCDLKQQYLFIEEFLSRRLITAMSETPSSTISGDVTVCCVDCRFKSNIDIKEIVNASPASGITAGSFNVNGNVHDGAGIGLDAQVEYKDTFSKQLV
jgi:hypothetical protein